MDAELNRKTLELRETGSQPNLEANPVYPVLNLVHKIVNDMID